MYQSRTHHIRTSHDFSIWGNDKLLIRMRQTFPYQCATNTPYESVTNSPYTNQPRFLYLDEWQTFSCEWDRPPPPICKWVTNSPINIHAQSTYNVSNEWDRPPLQYTNESRTPQLIYMPNKYTTSQMSETDLPISMRHEFPIRIRHALPTRYINESRTC